MMKHPSPDVIYFHTFPRSGSHWFRYCFEFITKRKSESLKDENIIWTKETGASYPRALYHSHEHFSFHPKPPHFPLPFTKNIIIVRNYKEAIFSELNNKLARYRDNKKNQTASDYDNNDPWVDLVHKKRLPIANIDLLIRSAALVWFQIPKDLTSMEQAINTNPIIHRMFLGLMGQYYMHLEWYSIIQNAITENAFFMYYEAFIQNPEQQLKKVINFLAHHSLPLLRNNRMYQNNLKELIVNLDYHRNICLGTYRKKGHLAKTYEKSAKDINFNYYSSFFSDEFLDKMDKSMERLGDSNVLGANNLYSNYLSHYKLEVK
jgi:hypothetical protein